MLGDILQGISWAMLGASIIFSILTIVASTEGKKLYLKGQKPTIEIKAVPVFATYTFVCLIAHIVLQYFVIPSILI